MLLTSTTKCDSGWIPGEGVRFGQLMRFRLTQYREECRIHKDSPIIPILGRINPILRVDTYSFKIHSNIALLSMPTTSRRSLSCRFNLLKFLKHSFLPLILVAWPGHLNILDLTTLTLQTVQTMKFYIVYPYPFSSFLGPNMRLRNLFSNTLSLQSSLNVRYHVSEL